MYITVRCWASQRLHSPTLPNEENTKPNYPVVPNEGKTQSLSSLYSRALDSVITTLSNAALLGSGPIIGLAGSTPASCL